MPKFFDDPNKNVKREQIPVRVPPRVVMNLILSLFLVSRHRRDFGEEAYAETMDVLADLVAGYNTKGTP